MTKAESEPGSLWNSWALIFFYCILLSNVVIKALKWKMDYLEKFLNSQKWIYHIQIVYKWAIGWYDIFLNFNRKLKKFYLLKLLDNGLKFAVWLCQFFFFQFPSPVKPTHPLREGFKPNVNQWITCLQLPLIDTVLDSLQTTNHPSVQKMTGFNFNGSICPLTRMCSGREGGAAKMPKTTGRITLRCFAWAAMNLNKQRQHPL